ncbi:hypothetical protein MKQ68_25200 [Chitinophaga horti]|uniref:Transposase n=1 Tax=Chitinophaga horti TaxID=2920382 RepID=A0ABY6J5C9_9BACT|nr:hypothetical protein [Chitinophaga horti]UYQ93384.1 hypothetical protein MKQ68_25200 [Chitinophaga horti]
MAPLNNYNPPVSRDLNYKTLICQLSTALKVPEALVTYVLLEKLYSEKPLECKRFLPQSALHHSVTLSKGTYQLITLYDRMFLRFADGTTISACHADMTWAEFFREKCIGRPQQIFTTLLEVMRKRGL